MIALNEIGRRKLCGAQVGGPVTPLGSCIIYRKGRGPIACAQPGTHSIGIAGQRLWWCDEHWQRLPLKMQEAAA